MVARGDHVRAVAGEAEQQIGEECRHGGGWVAESEDNLVVDAADIVNGEADDAADWLGVEEQQETRDSSALEPAELLAEMVLPVQPEGTQSSGTPSGGFARRARLPKIDIRAGRPE